MKKLITIIVSAFMCIQSYASTNVCGTIVSQTWTKAGSPYIVTCDILVAGLTIQPGVQVVFSGNYLFEVAGVLTAVGTYCDSITFTKDAGIAGWKGIQFTNSSPGSVLEYCRISNSKYSGIKIFNSTPIIQFCEISNNSSGTSGGGVYISQTSGLTSVIENSTIKNNYANPTNSSGSSFGGGMYGTGSLQLKNCKVDHNICYALCDYYPGCIVYARGGGIYWSGTLSIENSEITNNNLYASSGTIASSTIYCNGAGIFLNSGNLNCINSIIALNTNNAGCPYCTPNNNGSGIFVNSGQAIFTNNTIANNNKLGVYKSSGTVSIINSILYFNNGGGSQVSGIDTLTYSDVQGGYPGSGNINVNPIFYNSTFIIAQGSLCIDAGDLSAAYNDVCFPPSLGGIRNDMGAHGGPGACYWNVPVPCSYSVATTITNTSGTSCNNGKIKVNLNGTFLYYPRLELWSNGLIKQVNLAAGTTSHTFNNLNSGKDTLKVFDGTCCEKIFPLQVKCPKPSAGFSTTDITDTTAKVNWTIASCAKGYKVQFRKSGTTAWSTVNVNTNTGNATLTGLIKTYSYQWRLATKCNNTGAAVYSDYSAIQTFLVPRYGDIISSTSESESTLSVFPNPTFRNLTLDFIASYAGAGEIIVTDMTGRTILQKQIDVTENDNEQSIDISTLSKGIYLLRLKTKEGEQVARVVKQ